MFDFIIHAFASVLVPLFIFGMVGSAVVVAVTLVRDIRDFSSKDEPADNRSDVL